jgi:sialate O-acetylesterase
MKSSFLIPNKLDCLIVSVAFVLATGCRSYGYDFSYDRDDSRKTVAKLGGDWKFSVGDAAEWAQPDFNDKNWGEIHAPAYWQDEGYRNYHGYAWYRKSFDFPKGSERERILLSLGRVDDVDQVYINGKLVGVTGQFPPNYVSAYDQDRIYEVPAVILKPDQKNLIAVRVYDGGGEGGIYSGKLCLYTSSIPQPAIRLEGAWQFHPGDDLKWKEEHCEDSDFVRIKVPAYWEDEGYPDLHGFAWYRITFAATGKLADSTAVLLLGKVDDLDEVYLNGTFVGSTGNMKNLDRSHYDYTSPHAQSRAYFFPSSLLKETNTLAVRVYDLGGVGGIYAGPIGIMSQTDYARFWEIKKKENRGWLGRLWDGD